MQPLVAVATTSISTGWDIAGNFLALIVLIILLFLLGKYVGRGAFISLAVSFYAGYALFLAFPFLKQVTAALGGTAASASISAVVIYLAATFASYFVVRKAVSGDYFNFNTISLIVLSLLVAGFLLALAYHAFSISALYSYPSPLAHIFTPPAYFFWWFIAPLVGLIILA
jgi:hypothetical protein